MQFSPPPYIENKDARDPKKLLESLASHPEDALLLHGLLLHASFGAVDHDQCVKSADYLLEHSVDQQALFWANYLKGCVFEHRKKYDEAIPLLKKALELDPESEIQGTLAGIYMEKHLYDEALNYYHQLEASLIKRAKEDEDEFDDNMLCDEIAEAYFMKQDYKNALRYFQKSFDIKNDSTVAICGLGRVTADMGDNDKALEYFTRALALDPLDAYIYYYTGHAWEKKHDFYRAMHFYTEALKIKPDFAEVFNNIAALFVNEEGDFKTALDNLKKALEQTKPDSRFLITVYGNLARLYASIAEFDQAEYYKGKYMEAVGFNMGFEDLDNFDFDDDEPE